MKTILAATVAVAGMTGMAFAGGVTGPTVMTDVQMDAITGAGTLVNFQAGISITTDGIPGQAEIMGVGIANGTAVPQAVFPGGPAGMPDATTNRAASGVIEFDN